MPTPTLTITKGGDRRFVTTFRGVNLGGRELGVVHDLPAAPGLTVRDAAAGKAELFFPRSLTQDMRLGRTYELRLWHGAPGGDREMTPPISVRLK